MNWRKLDLFFSFFGQYVQEWSNSSGLIIEETCGFIDGHLTEANNTIRLVRNGQRSLTSMHSQIPPQLKADT